ncbi:hypothetical protein GCM10018952_41720 [Streptosporangium vulgare]
MDLAKLPTHGGIFLAPSGFLAPTDLLTPNGFRARVFGARVGFLAQVGPLPPSSREPGRDGPPRAGTQRVPGSRVPGSRVPGVGFLGAGFLGVGERSGR